MAWGLGTRIHYTCQRFANGNVVLRMSEPTEELVCGFFSYAVRAARAAISHLCNAVPSFDV